MDWTAFSLSLQLAAWTVALLLPIAILIARLLAWGRFRFKSVVESLLLLPLVLPPTVLGFYLLLAFSPQSAFGAALKSVVRRAAGVQLRRHPRRLADRQLAVRRAADPARLRSHPAQRARGRFVSGLSRWETMRRIELPLAWPGIVSAIALTFAHTLGEFGVILMIGGSIPGETRVLSISIYDSVQAFRIGEAGVMSAVLLAFSLAAIAVVHMLARRQRTGAHGP